jgi:hypothetical protein
MYMWARFCRKGVSYHTNMTAEAFHKHLKCTKFVKQNRRVDHLIHTLLNMAKEKTFEGFITNTKGKTNAKIKVLQNSHDAGVSVTGVTAEGSSGRWSVLSASTDTSHTVYQNPLDTGHSTARKVVCRKCQVCIHMFSSSCDMYSAKQASKHIHAVQIHISNLFGSKCH